jgi:hypothetical protein
MKLVVRKVEKKGADTIVMTDFVLLCGASFLYSTECISEKGLFQLGDASLTYDPPACLIKLPYKVGVEWDIRIGNGKCPRKAKAVGEEIIKVPAGSFRAVRIDMEILGIDKPADHMTYWYAPDVGLVKSTFNGKIVLALKSFNLGRCAR